MGASARYRPNLETSRLVYNGQVANLSYGVPHHAAEVLQYFKFWSPVAGVQRDQRVRAQAAVFWGLAGARPQPPTSSICSSYFCAIP